MFPVVGTLTSGEDGSGPHTKGFPGARTEDTLFLLFLLPAPFKPRRRSLGDRLRAGAQGPEQLFGPESRAHRRPLHPLTPTPTPAAILL